MKHKAERAFTPRENEWIRRVPGWGKVIRMAVALGSAATHAWVRREMAAQKEDAA